MDTAGKVKLLKFVGEIIAHPERLEREFKVLSSTENDGLLTVTLELSGAMAEMIKGFSNVQGSMEKR